MRENNSYQKPAYILSENLGHGAPNLNEKKGSEFGPIVAQGTTEELLIFRALVDAMNEGFAVVDRGASLTYVNKRFLEMLGYSYEEMIGHAVTDFVDEKGKQILKENIRKRVLHHSSKYELEWMAKDGSRVPTLVSGVPIVDQEGNFLGSFAVITNLSEMKGILERIEKSEEKYRMLIDNLRQGITIIQDDRYVFVNQAFADIVGYAIDELLAMSSEQAFELIHPDDRQFLLDLAERRNRGDVIKAPYEYRFICKDGSVKHVKAFSSNIEYEGRNAVQILIMDITDRKEIERELSESKRLLEMVINTIPMYVFWKDKNSTYLGCNQNFAITAGVPSPKDIIGKTDFDLNWPKENAEFYQKSDKEIMETRQPIIHSIEKLQYADTEMWIDLTKVPLIDENNEVIGVLGIYEDISERVKSEQAIKASEEKYRTLAEQSFQGMTILTRNGFAYVNKAFAEIVGRTKEELLSMTPDDIRNIVHPADLEMIEDRIAKWFAGEVVPPRHEWRFIRKNGEIRWVESFSTRVQYEDDIALQIILIDTTNRKNIEREVHTARDRALLYLDLMCHDLRNQLQVILNSATLLHDISDETMRSNFLDIIKNSIQRAARLIGEVQETEQLLNVPLVERDLAAALTTCIAALEGRSDTQFHYKFHIKRASVKADEFLELLLSNILLNAIEHNPKGKKEVWVDLSQSKDYYIVSIADNGPGISDTRKKELFDMTRRFGGIGLHQAYQIAEKYNGSIRVEDRVSGHPEEGAKFIIEIPRMVRYTD